jgi:hypothetical protein
MANSRFTVAELAEALRNLPDANLLGCQLLLQEQAQQGTFFPAIASERLIDATMQYLNYIEVTRQANSKLDKLQPIPLEESVEEFSI